MEDNPKRLSDAWPPNVTDYRTDDDLPRLKANVHEIISNARDKDLHFDKIYFSEEINPDNPQDELRDIKVLQEEWFPLQYDRSYYDQIQSGHIGIFLMILPVTVYLPPANSANHQPADDQKPETDLPNKAQK
jgi:hypothetical protein